MKAEFIHTDYMALSAHVRRRMRQRSLILIMTDLPESGGRQSLVRAARPNPEGDGDKLGKCVEKAVKKWKFQKGQDKKPYKVRFPLTVEKP